MTTLTTLPPLPMPFSYLYSMIHHLSRHQLNYRHQLSQEQIDVFLGEQEAAELPGDKALTLKKLKSFLEVTDALREAGIGFIPLKGFVLSQKLYGDPSFRFTGDADLLVKPGDMEKAIRLLQEIGYRPALYPWPAEPLKAQKLMRLRNQFALENPKSGLDVELHWRLLYYPVLTHGEMSRIVSKNLDTITLHGRSFQVLNRELDLLFLLIHGGMHGWRRLKWLVDVHEIARQKLFDPQRFILLVETFRAQRLLGLYNEVVKHWFDAWYPLPGPPKTKPFLVKTALEKIASDEEGEWHNLPGLWRYFRFVLTAFPGLCYKCRIISYAWRSLWISGAKPL
ncbi:MAG: nucleotidyltransferase family protein, partial [Bacteroides sp.]|nr:nucleotidyltransferase family protein [Bacteroides sp.]